MDKNNYILSLKTLLLIKEFVPTGELIITATLNIILAITNTVNLTLDSV